MKRRCGFTIVELIVVITAVAILASIGVVSYAGLQTRARDDERLADINTMAAALETYYEQKGSYPTIANMVEPNFISSTLRVPDAALTAPGAKNPPAVTFSYAATNSTAPDKYGYTPFTSDGSACNDATAVCTRYILTYTSEQKGQQTVRSKFGN